IRLVKILPGVQNADVSCSVVHVPVERTPKYRALSYVWGPPQPSRTISCNGALLNVRDNLYRALKYLSKQPAQYYWIDALCINQEDTEEKGKQVQCIGKIYSGAQEVLIWLGEDTP
ncbi:HET-domain-containing protein, partial [Lophiostoma macrostomum CBS 122681]